MSGQVAHSGLIPAMASCLAMRVPLWPAQLLPSSNR